MSLRKAAEQAFEFVSWFASDDHSIRPKHTAPEIAEALRQALAVKYMDMSQIPTEMPNWKPGMVFSKPKREWVGLTDEEVDEIYMHEGHKDVVLLAQAKLKEKNT